MTKALLLLSVLTGYIPQELPITYGPEVSYPRLEEGSGINAQVFEGAKYLRSAEVEVDGKKIPVQDLVGGMISTLVGKPGSDRANCFAATLKVFYPERDLVHVEEEIFHEKLLESFEVVPAKAKLEQKDVLVVWSKRTPNASDPREWVPGHAAVYVTNDVFFHKPSHADEHPFLLERLEQMKKTLDQAAKVYKTELRYTFYRLKK